MRHALVGHMVAAMQRLGFSATASLEHRRLAVDLAEVALKWELQRIRDHTHDDSVVSCTIRVTTSNIVIHCIFLFIYLSLFYTLDR